jgi:hypothetical protein
MTIKEVVTRAVGLPYKELCSALKFISCCLFPWEFSIKTENGYISDSFHLMGTSGIHVSPQKPRQKPINLLRVSPRSRSNSRRRRRSFF